MSVWCLLLSIGIGTHAQEGQIGNAVFAAVSDYPREADWPLIPFSAQSAKTFQEKGQRREQTRGPVSVSRWSNGGPACIWCSPYEEDSGGLRQVRYHMDGNVWEWMQDTSNAESDKQSRLCVGGSWLDKPAGFGPANRTMLEAEDKKITVGFRVFLPVILD
ncbi:MAG: SUMF1/EgtB/PvdO family nonheme iron enzyme [Planctomycetota bacterium]|nr:SUMF1/EgtB/PvdO family nonheme iron enzyme [Planctomycetota bacterium]